MLQAVHALLVAHAHVALIMPSQQGRHPRGRIGGLFANAIFSGSGAMIILAHGVSARLALGTVATVVCRLYFQLQLFDGLHRSHR
eukprot:7826271-Pyramimonas_sp.AAC.1